MKTPVIAARGRLFQVRGVSQYLGISEHKARRLIVSGSLLAVRSPAGRLEGVYEAECEAWVLRNQKAPDATQPVRSIDEQVRQMPHAGHFA